MNLEVMVYELFNVRESDVVTRMLTGQKLAKVADAAGEWELANALNKLTVQGCWEDAMTLLNHLREEEV